MIAMHDWERYIARLKKISDKAAAEMQAYVDRFGFDNTTAIINHAYALATRYGEAAATAACDMYDAVAAVSRVSVPAAVPAETAAYGDMAKAINGAIKQAAEGQVPQIVGRKVKQAGADTTLKNAIRDGAEFAWIPHGDTCAFCITLASRGWQTASEKALKEGHAEHIHSNCDCEYAVRFNDRDGVRGYNPDIYKRIYDSHGGDINSIRREQYQKNKEKINAQKRARYAEKHGATSIIFDPKIPNDQKRIISVLDGQYESRLKEVSTDRSMVANDTLDTAGAVDISGEVMVLNDKSPSNAIHEFAHTIAMDGSDKLGLSDNTEFWKEIKRIRRDYRKEMKRSLGDPNKQISFYEWTSGSIDEFMAEAFAHAKMKEMGIAIPAEYGKDFTYSKQVLAVINKYFGKK